MKNDIKTGDLAIIRDLMIAHVRSDGPDLTPRQLSAFLIIYTEDGPHTVRGLAEKLKVSKPAVTRAFDRLSELNLMRRKVDPADRRSVHAMQTPGGQKFVAQFNRHLESATEANRAA